MEEKENGVQNIRKGKEGLSIQEKKRHKSTLSPEMRQKVRQQKKTFWLALSGGFAFVIKQIVVLFCYFAIEGRYQSV